MWFFSEPSVVIIMKNTNISSLITRIPIQFYLKKNTNREILDKKEFFWCGTAIMSK